MSVTWVVCLTYLVLTEKSHQLLGGLTQHFLQTFPQI